MGTAIAKPEDRSWKKSVALFLVSQSLSLFGSSVVGFAVLWHITLETSSGVWLMLATVCTLAPQAVISLWAGVWADRYNRKRLIILADGFIAAATLSLAVAFVAGLQRLELLLAVSAVRSLGAGIQTPAVGAIFPQLVPQDKLTRMQGINQTLMSVLLLLAPAVGGVVLGTMGIVWTFMLDVGTALLAIVVLSLVKTGKTARTDESGSVVTEIRQGLRYTFGHAALRPLIVCYAWSFFLITPAAILTPLLIERSFGGEVWRLTANEVVWTVGSLIGGVYVSWRGNFADKVRTIAFCLVGFGAAFALLGAAVHFPVYLTIMGIAGFFMPVITSVQTVFIQEAAEPTVLGRVFSIVQLIASSAMPIAILLFGPLADVLSVEAILVVSGAALALVGVWYRWTGMRNRQYRPAPD